MTRLEKSVESNRKEIEAAEKSLSRYKGLLEKKIAKCEKLNCNWTREEMFVKRDANEMTDEQFQAYFNKAIEEDHVQEKESQLQLLARKQQRLTGELGVETEGKEKQAAVTAKISSLETEWSKLTQEEKKKRYETWLKKFKADCLEDGIIVDQVDQNFMNGSLVKSNKRFVLYINNGWTDRSDHCYTLRIDGHTYFTSGSFQTCYRYLMNH